MISNIKFEPTMVQKHYFQRSATLQQLPSYEYIKNVSTFNTFKSMLLQYSLEKHFKFMK